MHQIETQLKVSNDIICEKREEQIKAKHALDEIVQKNNCRIKELNDSIITCKKQIVDLKTQLKKEKSKMNTLVESIMSKDNRLIQAEKAQSSLKTKVADQECKILLLQELVDDCDKHKRSLQAHLRSKQKEVESKEQTITKMKEDLKMIVTHYSKFDLNSSSILMNLNAMSYIPCNKKASEYVSPYL